MEDLKKFKAEYNELLDENARLKRQAGSRAVVVMNDGRTNGSDNRLYQYKDLVSEMQSVMKWFDKFYIYNSNNSSSLKFHT